MTTLMSPGKMQEYNSFIVLKIIRSTKKISRADIARILNCSKSAISGITRRLEEYNLIVNSGQGSPHTGRKSTLIKFNDKAQYLLSIRMSKKYFQIALVDLNGNISHFKELEYESSNQEGIINHMRRSIKNLLDKVKDQHVPVKYLGVTVPGIVNAREGRVLYSSNLNWETPVNLSYELEQGIGLPVFIDNDANAMALAESWCGVAAEYEDFLSIFIDKKIGGAYIHRKNIVHGKNWTSAELGKFLVPHKGDFMRIEDIFNKVPIQEKIEALGYLISSLYITHDPEAVIIQDNFAAGTPLNLDSVIDRVRSFLPSSPHRQIILKTTEIREEKRILGGAAIALSRSPFHFIIGTEE